MGSRDRFTFGFTDSMMGIGLGFNISRFPFTITINVHLLICWFSIGLGKGYDQ